MTRSQIHRTSLRLDRGTYLRVERALAKDGGRLTMSAWLDRAIREQLARDGVNESAAIYAVKAASTKPDFCFYEFFAGGGMARAGLGRRWACVLANDIDAIKARTYRQNWDGGAELLVGDINGLSVDDLPTPSHMAWASFPCQDLSLAGNYGGIGHRRDKIQTRSGTVWAFWRLIESLHANNQHPPLIVLENVYGVLTANGGRDFSAIGTEFSRLGYRFGAVVLDARHFVPQSRPRVFIVGARGDLHIPSGIASGVPTQFGTRPESFAPTLLWMRVRKRRGNGGTCQRLLQGARTSLTLSKRCRRAWSGTPSMRRKNSSA